MIRKHKIHALILLWVLWQLPFQAAPAYAAGQYQAHQVRAIFLFNLANFVSWPEDAFESPNSPIRIIVVGQKNFADFLEKVVQGESARGRPLVVERRQRPEDLDDSHIIFMGADLEKKWNLLFKAVAGKKILTVSDADSFTRKGGMVGLVNQNKRIVIEIHAERAKRSGLQISSKLLKLARVTR